MFDFLRRFIPGAPAKPVVVVAPVVVVKPPPTAADFSNFSRCFDFVMQFDGKKDDRAPTENFATAYGVTEMTWAEAIRIHVIRNKPISQATKDDCYTILRMMFYEPPGCAKMKPGCDLMVFNNAMACGEGHAARLVQRVVGVGEDGTVGPITLAAVNKMAPKAFIDAMAEADEAYYAALKNAPTYLKGWDRREEEARTLAYKMAGVAA